MTTIITFFVVIFILIYLIINKHHSSIYLYNKPQAIVQFNKLLTSPVTRGYFESLNECELKIRKIPQTSTNAAIYKQNFQNFNIIEKKILNNTILNIIRFLPNNINRILKTGEWKFIKTNNHVEGGMPFTLGDIIFIPQGLLTKMLLYYKSNNIEGLKKDIISTLIHEKIHVAQRDSSTNDKFCKLYQKWHFTRSPKSHNDNSNNQTSCIRNNPDIYTSEEDIGNPYWLWKEQLSLYPQLDKNSDRLSGVKVIANNNKLYDEYKMFFGNSRQIEHPNEISAVMLADILTFGEKEKNPAKNTMIEYFNL
jgi:hypothetical protein